MATLKKDAAAAVHRIFVRIGALRRFHTLTQRTADLPVEVSWDRRRDDRRSSSAAANGDVPTENVEKVELQQPDRRQKPPFTWETADFVLVEAPPPPSKGPTEKG